MGEMVGQFLDPLIVQAYAKGEWVLMADFRYMAADGTIYTAPKYFITDLASTPWLVKPFLTGIEDRACGVIHDFVYCQNKITRAQCDALFYEMLLATGADLRRAQLMFSGLRIGGGSRYRQCAGGMKVEDLAFELMRPEEVADWKLRLLVIHEPVAA
ncbi:DUF1353 domain-containing protein [Pseudomonas syringae]|uniref:DUF1353 domain-containing protein n=1 Tax=Pseudomonas syringae TaxID=317 RepID=UPI000515C4C3|nr:DUF1353 domain-containing protein [Pseudomonas syringae]